MSDLRAGIRDAVARFLAAQVLLHAPGLREHRAAAGASTCAAEAERAELEAAAARYLNDERRTGAAFVEEQLRGFFGRPGCNRGVLGGVGLRRLFVRSCEASLQRELLARASDAVRHGRVAGGGSTVRLKAACIGLVQDRLAAVYAGAGAQFAAGIARELRARAAGLGRRLVDRARRGGPAWPVALVQDFLRSEHEPGGPAAPTVELRAVAEHARRQLQQAFPVLAQADGGEGRARQGGCAEQRAATEEGKGGLEEEEDAVADEVRRLVQRAASRRRAEHRELLRAAGEPPAAAGPEWD